MLAPYIEFIFFGAKLQKLGKLSKPLQSVTISAKNHIICTSINIEKNNNLKIICEIMHTTRKKYARINGASNW